MWFTEKFLVPNSSVVMETAIEVIAPVHTPIMAVPMKREKLAGLRSKKKAPPIGATNATINAGLEIVYLLLEK